MAKIHLNAANNPPPEPGPSAALTGHPAAQHPDPREDDARCKVRSIIFIQLSPP